MVKKYCSLSAYAWWEGLTTRDYRFPLHAPTRRTDKTKIICEKAVCEK